MTTSTLDARGLSCPLPILRANRAVKELIPGDVIEVLVTDANSPADFEAFCEATKNELLGVSEKDGVFTISIKIL